MLKDKLAAYDKERNALRRADPAYAAAQLERKRAWKAANAERHRRVAREHEQLQRSTNPQRRIAKNLRHRLSKAMQGKTKGVSAVRDLGMSIEDFRAYIAAMFQPGMTWDNYGHWHLDHIKPLASFDLTDPAQAKAAVHYSNLQPLWAIDNQRKADKVPHRDRWNTNYPAALSALAAAA